MIPATQVIRAPQCTSLPGDGCRRINTCRACRVACCGSTAAAPPARSAALRCYSGPHLAARGCCHPSLPLYSSISQLPEAAAAWRVCVKGCCLWLLPQAVASDVASGCERPAASSSSDRSPSSVGMGRDGTCTQQAAHTHTHMRTARCVIQGLKHVSTAAMGTMVKYDCWQQLVASCSTAHSALGCLQLLQSE